MVFTVVFGILWLLFVCTTVYSLIVAFSAPTLMAALGGLIGLTKAFVDSLSKEDLRVYFFMQRLRIRLHSGAITRWWFAARFDGEYSQATIADLIHFMSDRTRFKFPIQIDFQMCVKHRCRLTRRLSCDCRMIQPRICRMQQPSHNSIVGTV